ncbi:MAG TPA: hypothetical protein PKD69_08080, partial [Elusimicrobiota bacterium]|nr:hypothetical protein [Elusimicrobiota bacterium]
MNDLVDLEADRAHPKKRFRPFASGDLPLHVGFVLAPVLLTASLGAAWLFSKPLAALLATAFDFGTMLFLGASGLGLISLASRPTKGPAATTASTKAPKSLLRWAGLGILLLGLAWTARAAGMMEGSNPAANVSKTIGADLAAPTPTRTGALPVLGAAVIPFRKARSRVATFPGRRSRSTREVDPEAGTPPVETTVRLRNEGAQWLAEEKASGRFYGVLADWIESSGPGSPHGSRHGTEPAGPFQEAAFNPLTARALRFLAWQTDQALRTRDRGLRPTAEAIRMAYFWGLAGGTPSELPPLLAPVVSPFLRGTLPKPLFHSWLNGQSARAASPREGPAAWRLLQTLDPGFSDDGAPPTASEGLGAVAAKGFRGASAAVARLFTHPATPALLTLVTLPVLFGANLLGLL